MERGKTIAILGTGGTIAGVAHSAGSSVGYRSAQLDIGQLLQAVPDLEDVAKAPLITEQIAQLDSKDMDHCTWRALAVRCAELIERADVGGIVITHGTDTLEETAWFLQCVLPATKPVVLTCAMRPATAISADGPGNLRDAVACAADRNAAGRGVLVVANGVVFGARHVHKAHPYRVEAFASMDAGPAGWVEEAYVRWASSVLGSDCSHAMPPASALAAAQQWPVVEMLYSHAGCNAGVAQAMLQGMMDQGLRGLVVVGTGNGTIHCALEEALQHAQNQGVAIRRTTRCEQGQIVQSPLHDDSQVSYLPPAKARISLMLELMGWPRTDR